MAVGVEPVFTSRGPVWPLAGMVARFEPNDPDLDIPHDAVRNGIREAPERHFPVHPDHSVTHTATEPLAPTKPLPKGGKWNLAIVASCIFHAAIAGLFLYAVDEAVLMEGADFSGVAYLGSGEDQIKAGEISEDVDDAVDVTMVTMLQAKPVETVEAEAVPVEEAAEPMETVEAAAAATETLKPVSEVPLQQLAEAKAETVKSEPAEAVRTEAEQAVQAEVVQAEPVESKPAPAVTEQIPEVLATDRLDKVEDDNVVRKQAAQATEPVQSTEVVAAEPAQTSASVETAQPATSESAKTENAETVQAVEIEQTKVETMDVAKAEPSDAKPVKPVEEAKPETKIEDKPQPHENNKAKKPETPAKKAETKKETDKPKTDDKGKKVAEKAKPKKSGNGGQSQANTRRGQADGQEKGDSKQASRGGSKNGQVGNAAISNYPGKVRSKLVRAARSVRAKGKGEVIVAFALGSSGHVQSARVARSSGVASVDQAALQAVRKASPFPPIPANAGRSNWEFSVPLAFMR